MRSLRPNSRPNRRAARRVLPLVSAALLLASSSMPARADGPAAPPSAPTAVVPQRVHAASEIVRSVGSTVLTADGVLSVRDEAGRVRFAAQVVAPSEDPADLYLEYAARTRRAIVEGDAPPPGEGPRVALVDVDADLVLPLVDAAGRSIQRATGDLDLRRIAGLIDHGDATSLVVFDVHGTPRCRRDLPLIDDFAVSSNGERVFLEQEQGASVRVIDANDCREIATVAMAFDALVFRNEGGDALVRSGARIVRVSADDGHSLGQVTDRALDGLDFGYAEGGACFYAVLDAGVTVYDGRDGHVLGTIGGVRVAPRRVAADCRHVHFAVRARTSERVYDLRDGSATTVTIEAVTRTEPPRGGPTFLADVAMDAEHGRLHLLTRGTTVVIDATDARTVSCGGDRFVRAPGGLLYARSGEQLCDVGRGAPTGTSLLAVDARAPVAIAFDPARSSGDDEDESIPSVVTPYVFDLATGRRGARLPGAPGRTWTVWEDGPTNRFAFSADGRYIARLDDAAELGFAYDARSGRVVARFSGDADEVAFAADPSSSLLVLDHDEIRRIPTSPAAAAVVVGRSLGGIVQAGRFVAVEEEGRSGATFVDLVDGSRRSVEGRLLATEADGRVVVATPRGFDVVDLASGARRSFGGAFLAMRGDTVVRCEGERLLVGGDAGTSTPAGACPARDAYVVLRADGKVLAAVRRNEVRLVRLDDGTSVTVAVVAVDAQTSVLAYDGEDLTVLLGDTSQSLRRAAGQTTQAPLTTPTVHGDLRARLSRVLLP